ncbi:hypothetical protein KKG83_07585 [Candidatus Micrarchaeota archaeon]|nr:hypothetical protein [Candidatus Micrarchaeota archaeon]MBU2477302.1 hypothetical protein [Candidatus Micrarchaeota archaeon]
MPRTGGFGRRGRSHGSRSKSRTREGHNTLWKKTKNIIPRPMRVPTKPLEIVQLGKNKSAVMLVAKVRDYRTEMGIQKVVFRFSHDLINTNSPGQIDCWIGNNGFRLFEQSTAKVGEIIIKLQKGEKVREGGYGSPIIIVGKTLYAK